MLNTTEQFDTWANAVAQETGFALGRGIYRDYYSEEQVRGAIYDGEYEGRAAVLKLYDDPRGTDEPLALKAFHGSNRSKILTAPQLYDYKILSPHKGWMIVEKLPEKGAFLPAPITTQEDKRKFAELFLEYRRNFPTEPHRPLYLAEQLSAEEYHTYRVLQWFRLANDKESGRELAGEKNILDPQEFILRYTSALGIIREEFGGRRMIWSHSHFKPSEVYKPDDESKFYLIDFAHTSLKPEGYELAFIIWGNHIIDGDWSQPYEPWRNQVEEWLEVFQTIKHSLGWNNFDNLMKASLLERCLGTILADIASSDRPHEEKMTRIGLVYHLMDDLLQGRLL